MSNPQLAPPAYQKTPAAVLTAMVAAAADSALSDGALRDMIRGISHAVERYEQERLSLRDIILTAHENPASPDHALAKRVVTATIACKQFDAAAVRTGALQRHLALSSDLVNYAEAIRDGELDGSEPEFSALIDDMNACGEELLINEKNGVGA